MKDNGNGLKIELADKKIKLEYHEAVELLFLLMSNVNQSFEFRESKTIKKWGKGEDIEIVESLK